MRFRHHPFALFLIFTLACPVTAQERLADILADPAIQLSRPADRARVVARMAAIENTRRQNARARAALLGLPLRTELPNGRVQEIADFNGDKPVYLTTHNANAAISTGANLLRNSPYSLTGSGVTIGLWDGGSARSAHLEFGGRLTVMDGAASIDHASHVGGTLIASGVDANARGMADSATVHSYDWTNDASEMTSRGASSAGEPGKINLSNHSYGYASGWTYVNGGSPYRLWEWYGAGSTSTSIDSDFGLYNSYARDGDALAFNAPYYLIFRSAGNDNGDNPASGSAVALSPGSSSVVSYSSASHPGGDAIYRGGFETIGFDAVAKNVITVGSAADAVTGGVRDPSKAGISSFSSCGPTDDGRIKPDVVANGDTLYSSLGGSNTAYGTYSGTSMATPNAAGSAALLIQQYSGFFPGQAMRASTLKGLLIHTADDRGNAGPDYKYGWGMVNVQAAADLIRDHSAFPAKQRVTENQLTTSIITRTQSFVWDGVSPVSATLCWTDPAAAALTISDSRSARLINNLNLKIIAPNGSQFLPYVMPFVGTWTQASMDLPATTGVNNTDNIEQVRIAAPPAAGTYQAVVTFSGTLTNSSQNYSLLISGSTADTPPPPPLALASVSPNSGLPGTVTLDITGTSLRADTAVKLARTGQPNIIATAVQLIGETLRCQVNLTGAAAGAWDVVATNPNLQTATLPAAFTVTGAIWSENFDGTVTGWTSQATIGSNSWSLVTTQSQSTTKSYFAAGPSTKSTTSLTSPSIAIPAGATSLQLKFWQNRSLQSAKDAGRLEFSIDNGSTWFDVEAAGSGAVFASNGYSATVSSKGNPNSLSEFFGKRAWSGDTTGFVETIVNLTDTAKYAGKNLRLRWIIATDASTASSGWYIDSIALLGGGDLSNQAPVITTAASSSSTETVTDPDSTVYQIVHTTSTNLSVAATDDGGEPSLTYTWAVTNSPTHPVFFTANATNAAKATTAEFEGTGDYQIIVSARDSQGLTVTSEVNIRVLQAASGLIVSPAVTTVSVGSNQAFSASLLDQFSVPMATQPSSFAWSKSGGGTISATGVFTATNVGGPFVITAASGGFSNNASVSVTPAPASVVLGNLSQTYSGDTKTVTVTTNPTNLSTAVTYDGSPAAPIHAGSYAVEANITDPNYQGSASATLVIQKATAAIDLTGLNPTYDGSPKSVTVTTTPAGRAFSITYNDSATLPTNAGSYAVVAAITDPDYQASPASATLVIQKATAAVTLAGLAATHDGNPKPVTATSTPAVAAIEITYNGSPDAPTAAGTYAVVATVNDPNYQGDATGSLVIAPGNDFTSWQNLHFSQAERTDGMAAENADPDSDSMPNLAEYALGTDPSQFTPPLVGTRDGNGFSLVFTRPAGLPGVTYEAESSEDLGTWSPVPLELLTPGTTETLRARDPLDTGDPSRRFLRLRFGRQ